MANLATLVGARSMGRWEIRHMECGTPFYAWKRPMARIQDEILDCVVYLYPSTSAAEEGRAAGGTGFLVGVPWNGRPDDWHIYAVTNSHVLRQPMGGATVIRMNTQSGDYKIRPFDPEDWVHHPNADDVAVLPLGRIDQKLFRFKVVPIRMFMNQDLLESEQIGPGDETFMVGRFVNHEGRQRNKPTVRFGNISMMNGEPIKTKRGILQDVFLVETRSLGGYSGSPVFVYIPGTSRRPADHPTSVVHREEKGPWLLGVDCGHVQQYTTVETWDAQSEIWCPSTRTGLLRPTPVRWRWFLLGGF